MSLSGVTFPKGFMASSAGCGLKKSGEPDLAVVYSSTPATCAGIFTKNRVKGHSLELCMKHVQNSTARAIVINAGNANACIGPKGEEDALKICQTAASLLGIAPGEVLPGSTGVIGVPLPVDQIEKGLALACPCLSQDGGESAARAIMTTDTVVKQAQAELEVMGKRVHIGAMAKGSGMIHPDMATMISVITTDAILSKERAQKLLRDTADLTYNRVSVDGDTSVCDKVLLLANGESGADCSDSADFEEALLGVCDRLARLLASDGEGATKLLIIDVKNTPDQICAKLIAQAIAKSPLCKTAAFGRDANWGRILTAAGYSGADFDYRKCDVYIGEILVCNKGCAQDFDEEAALSILGEDEVRYTVDLNAGSAGFYMYTCDFSYDYIKINAHYRT